MPRLLGSALLTILPILVWEAESCAEDIPLLVKALDDENVRQGASIALSKLGKTAVPALKTSLASGQPDVRVWSAHTLGEIGQAAESALGDLIATLTDSDETLRSTAAQALGKIRAPAAVDGLANALDDQNERVRRQAAVALGQIGPASHAATARLIAALSDHQVRRCARDALIQIGPSTAELLVDSLDDNNIRFDISVVLLKVDPAKAMQLGLDKPTTADLRSLHMVLYDTTRQRDEHLSAAMSLADLGEKGFAILIRAFDQEQIARTAASAFSQAGRPAVRLLVEALAHPRPDVRATAADAIGHIGPVASDAVPVLIRLLKDQDRDVRNRAVRALHELAQSAQPAIPALTDVIFDSRELESTRQWAIKTLVVTLPDTHDAVVKALVRASDEKTNYGVRQLARQQLRKVAPKAAEAAGIK